MNGECKRKIFALHLQNSDQCGLSHDENLYFGFLPAILSVLNSMAINKGWFYFHRYFFALAFDYLYFRFHFSIERNKVESIMLTDFEIGFKKR